MFPWRSVWNPYSDFSNINFMSFARSWFDIQEYQEVLRRSFRNCRCAFFPNISHFRFPRFCDFQRSYFQKGFGIFSNYLSILADQNQYYLSLETPGYSNNSRKSRILFEKYYFGKSRKLINRFWVCLGTDQMGSRNKLKILLICFAKSWIWDQYLPETMK